MKKLVMIMIALLLAIPAAAEEYSGSFNPLELHQFYMKEIEKFGQHRFLIYQQVLAHFGELIKSALMGAVVLYAHKINSDYDPESWTSSHWINKTCCAAVALVILKEASNILLARTALTEIATMEASLDAEYNKQLRYLMLGQVEEEPALNVDSLPSHDEESVSEEPAVEG